METLIAAEDGLQVQHGLPSSAVVSAGKVRCIKGEAMVDKVTWQPCSSLTGQHLEGVIDISEEEYLRLLMKVRPELQDVDFLDSDELEDYDYPEIELDPDKYLDTFDSQQH